jgi:hypothetical protein
MGVIVEDIRITNEFTGSTTNYLLGNVGDKITIEVDFRAEEVFVTEAESDVDRIMLCPAPFRVNVADTSDIIHCEESGVFENYRIGDTLRWWNGTSLSSNYLVYEKIDDQTVRVQTSGGGSVDFTGGNPANIDNVNLAINSYIFLSTNLTSVKYRWNFIENLATDTFLNKIDGQINQARVGGLAVAGDNDSMVFDSPVTNNYGSIICERAADFVNVDGVITSKKFTLTHETIITPFFLGGQKFDLEDGIAPSYYASAECLKYITSIDVGRNDNDPNFIQTVDFNALDGNTGWYAENFNGGNNFYSIGSVTYKRADLSVIDSVELTDNTQTVEIDVYSQNGTFSNNNTEFALNFSILPDEQEDYTFNGKTVVENFYFDRAFNTVGSAGVSGDNNATDEQIFTDVSAAFVDANNITITATIDLTATGVSDLTSKDFEYYFWVAIQDHTKDTEDSDRVSLVADIQPFYIDLTDDGMITNTTKFLRHYETDVETEGTETLIARTEDDVLGYTQFVIDRTGRASDDISINYIKAELVAKKTDGTEFTLEEYEENFTGTQIVGDSQFIDSTVERSFKMPDGDDRKSIKVKRRLDLDTTDLRYYEFYYPFLVRWEYWVALQGVDSDAFDTAEPNNGYNEEWVRYDTLTDWDIYYRIEINANKNGNSQLYRTDTLITTKDYLEATDWINEDIEAFNADTLATNGTLLIEPTKVVATKEYTGASVPASAADVEWVMRMEVYENGGISDIRYLSSVYDWTQYSFFKSVDASNKVIKNKSGNVFTAEALIDYSKLPTDATFKISARIYDESALAPITFCILQEDLEEIQQENATDCIEVEHT